MFIKVNGEKKEMAVSLSISALLKELNVEQPDAVSVQLNGEFVDRSRFNITMVQENDEVDFLYFMGGGFF